MSLKAVEMQVALPRTQEAGRVQEQLQQRTMHEQQGLIADRRHLDEMARQRSANVDETDKGQIRDRQEKQRRDRQHLQQQPSANRRAAGREELVVLADPLRGRHIDISL